MKVKRVLVSSGALVASLLFHSSLFAQQPGSAAYNSRVLPAHGLGDTRSKAMSWGAASMGEDGRLGWAANQTSEEVAKSVALRNCTDRGGTKCVIEAVYANGCIAIAANDSSSSISTAPDLETAKSRALERCGKDCEIFRDDCSLP